MDFKNVISKSALVASALWIIVVFVGSLIATGGKILLSGGGATIFSYIPALVFFLSLYFLEKNKSKYFLHSALVFWFCVLVSAALIVVFVSKMDHWPFGVAAVYILFGLVALVQALVFKLLSYNE